MNAKWNEFAKVYGEEIGGYRRVYTIGYHVEDDTLWKAEYTCIRLGDEPGGYEEICTGFVDFGDSFAEIMAAVDEADRRYVELWEGSQSTVRVSSDELAVRSIMESVKALLVIFQQTSLISVYDEAMALQNTAKFIAALNGLELEIE